MGGVLGIETRDTQPSQRGMLKTKKVHRVKNRKFKNVFPYCRFAALPEAPCLPRNGSEMIAGIVAGHAFWGRPLPERSMFHRFIERPEGAWDRPLCHTFQTHTRKAHPFSSPQPLSSPHSTCLPRCPSNPWAMPPLGLQTLGSLLAAHRACHGTAQQPGQRSS